MAAAAIKQLVVGGNDQRQLIRESFAKAARKQAPGEPLDWLTNSQPRKWKLDGEIRTFDWGNLE